MNATDLHFLKEGQVFERKAYGDVDVKEISRCLATQERLEWSTRPRTYIVLRIIDRLDVMNAFVTEGLYDIALPYSEKTLPHALEDSPARAKFLEAQAYVLTPEGLDLESGDGGHAYLQDDSVTQLEHVKDLGSGGFGHVDMVWSRLSLREYARKRMPRGRTFKRDKAVVSTFERELATLKRLSHTHLVKFVGSYTDPKYVCIIMSPVATSNLKSYLETAPFPLDWRPTLRRFFGCLSTALRYLHENRIRHKDIKPGNILVHGDNVLFTDFGTSLDWSDQGQSTTRERPDAHSVGYCSPEVAAWEPRNSSSDIWSLGCVFLGMTTILKGRSPDQLRHFFLGHGTGGSSVRTNLDGSKSWVRELLAVPNSKLDDMPIEWLLNMTKTNPRERPSSAELVDRIQRSPGALQFCGACCLGGQDGAAPVQVGKADQSEIAEEERGRDDDDDDDNDDDDDDETDDASQNSASEEAIQLLLEQGIDVEDDDFDGPRDGTLALPWAISSRNKEVIELLTNKGADLNDRIYNGKPPLHAALREQDEDLVYILRGAGASTTRTDHDGKTALFWATVWGRMDVVYSLVEKTEDVNVRVIYGRSLLEWAITQTESSSLIQLLMAKGVNLEARTARGETVLHLLASWGDTAMTRLLTEHGANVEAKTEWGETPLHKASKDGEESTVRFLLDAGAKVNARADAGETALLVAVCRGHPAIVNMLVERGANVALRTIRGDSPTLSAVRNGDEATLALLLKQRPTIKARNMDLDPLLRLAVWQGHENVLQLLLEKGGKVQSVGKGGATLLHLAAESGKVNVARVLLDRGLHLDGTDDAGLTALDLAAKHGRETVKQLLIDQGMANQSTLSSKALE